MLQCFKRIVLIALVVRGIGHIVDIHPAHALFQPQNPLKNNHLSCIFCKNPALKEENEALKAQFEELSTPWWMAHPSPHPSSPGSSKKIMDCAPTVKKLWVLASLFQKKESLPVTPSLPPGHFQTSPNPTQHPHPSVSCPVLGDFFLWKMPLCPIFSSYPWGLSTRHGLFKF